jgi:hypothetical protein
MPPGGSVLEIGVRQRPNANFYALACALEHRYAVVLAETAGLRMPVLYDDARADVARVESTLNAMSSQYEQQ